MITADFKLSGKIPFSKLLLINRVSVGSMSSTISKKKCVGIGSRGQDVGFALRIIFLTSSSVTEWNALNLKLEEVFGESDSSDAVFVFIVKLSSNSERMICILLVKYSENNSGSSSKRQFVGRG